MVSIVTPVLNGEAFVRQNITTIQGLSFDHEHIFVDGGSEDRTLEILAEYPHLKVLHQAEKSGMYGAIEQGFSLAKGDLFGYVNCDDEIVLKGFEKMIEVMTADASLDLVYANAKLYYRDKDKHVLMKAKQNAKFFLKQAIMPFVQPSSLYRRDAYFEKGRLRYDEFRICGDLDMFQRMVLAGAKLKYVPEVATIFLKYDGSLAAVSQVRKNDEVKKLKSQPTLPQFILKILFNILP